MLDKESMHTYRPDNKCSHVNKTRNSSLSFSSDSGLPSGAMQKEVEEVEEAKRGKARGHPSLPPGFNRWEAMFSRHFTTTQ